LALARQLSRSANQLCVHEPTMRFALFSSMPFALHSNAKCIS
jgi:hypothetical protein